MSTITRKPPRKETVGSQYVCFDSSTNGEWTGKYDAEVEKTDVVKSVKVTENIESVEVYGSGKVYDTDTIINKTDIEISVLAFPIDTLSKMRAETIESNGLHLSGGNINRPFFAYGKVVKLKGDNIKYEWYPRCKLVNNSDEIATRETSVSEQNDTITISAYPFDEDGNICTYVDSSSSTFPTGMTEEKFFAKPVLSAEDIS